MDDAAHGRSRVAPGRAPGPPGFRVFALAFALFFLASAAWSLAAPLGSPPDEPAQLIRAASLVRGQIIGSPLAGATPAQGSVVVVNVPEVFASLANDINCFKRNPKVPAGCQAPLVPSPQDQPVETYVGRYPPLYYAIVGLPTLVLVSVKGVYAARLASAALCAAMLALGLLSALRCQGRPFLSAGVPLAVTPMVLYLGGVLNPSGFEVASAVAAFAGALAIAFAPLHQVGPAMLARLGVPVVVLELVRALSPLWALAALAVLACLRGWADLKPLLYWRAVQAWLAVGALAAVAALVWDLAAGGLRVQPGTAVPTHAGTWTVAHLALDRLHLVAVSSIGLFGWLDTTSPIGVVTAWALAVAIIFLLGLYTAGARQSAVVALLPVAWVMFCYGFILAMVPNEGFEGQGRDFLGLAVGIPLVAGACARAEALAAWGRRWCAPAIVVVMVTFTACQVTDFYGTLRRYTVGTSGPMNAFSHVPGGWAPPLPGPVLVGAFVAGVAGVAWLAGLSAVRGAAGRTRLHSKAVP